MKTKEEILNVISEVKHPAINHSLVDLGIVKDIEIDDKAVDLKFAFPFPNIPIGEMLINSIKTPLNDIGYGLRSDVVLMNEQEKAKFMQMEAEAWKGM